MYQEKAIICDDFTYQAKEWHDSSLPPILALHGWLDNAGSFDCIAPLLKHFFIVAPDLPGHGLSPHKKIGSKYHYVDYLNDVNEIIKFYGWDKVILLGHSMGAGISTLFAGTFPKKIQKLILIEGIGPLVSEPHKSVTNLKKAITQFQVLKDKKPTIYKSYTLAETTRKKAGDLTIASVRILLNRGLKKVAGGYTWTSDDRLKCKSPIQFTEAHIVQFLMKIEAETLLVQGDQSYLRNIVPAKERSSHIKNIKIVELKGGHHLHMDHPIQIAESIINFLENK